MTRLAKTKNFLLKREIQDLNTRSHIDIKFKTDSIQRIVLDSKTGYKPDKVYESTININSSDIPISVSGSEAQTIGELIDQINIGVSGIATVVFSDIDQSITIVNNATGAQTIDFTVIGSLITELTGDRQISFKTKLLPGVVNSGVNFLISNMASVENPSDVGFISKAIDSTGVEIPIIETYNNETGVLQILKNSADPFNVGDSITVIGNIFG